MSLIQIQTEKIPARVYERLLEFICENDLRPGEKLPAQKELARRLGISMASLREGLQYAEGVGLIHSRHGLGTFIQEPSADKLFESQQASVFSRFMTLSDKEWQDLLQMRSILETAAAAIGAQRITRDDIGKLEECLDHMKCSLGNIEKFAEADLDFHCILIHSAGNLLLEQVYSNMKDLLWRHHMVNFQVKGVDKKSIVAHGRILEALKQRDPEEARIAMEEHIAYTTAVASRVMRNRNL